MLPELNSFNSKKIQKFKKSKKNLIKIKTEIWQLKSNSKKLKNLIPNQKMKILQKNYKNHN